MNFRFRLDIHCSSVSSSSRPPGDEPAHVTRMSMRPNFPSAAFTARSTSSLLLMSPATAITSRCVIAVISRAVSSSGCSVRAVMTTLAPSRASSSATARPMPLLAPVTSATLPVSWRSMDPSLLLSDDPRQYRARVKSVAGVQVLRARRDRGDDAVDERAQDDLVARLAGRDLVAERADLVDGRVLDDVDDVGDLPLLVLPLSERLGEVRAAAPVVLDAVVELVAPRVAHRRDQVVRAYLIRDHRVHVAPPVRLQAVADREVQAERRRARVRGGEPLGAVLLVDGDEVGNLLAFDVDYLEQRALRHAERATVTRRHQDLFDHLHDTALRTSANRLRRPACRRRRDFDPGTPRRCPRERAAPSPRTRPSPCRPPSRTPSPRWRAQPAPSARRSGRPRPRGRACSRAPREARARARR